MENQLEDEMETGLRAQGLGSRISRLDEILNHNPGRLHLPPRRPYRFREEGPFSRCTDSQSFLELKGVQNKIGDPAYCGRAPGVSLRNSSHLETRTLPV